MKMNQKAYLPSIYRYGLLFSFVSTLSPWFLWPIKGFGVLLVLFTTLYAFVKTPVLFILTKEKLCVIGLLFAFYCTLGLTANFNGYVSNFINFLSVAGLVCLNRENKIELLTFVSKGFAGIVLVSFLYFVMTFASGLSLPYESVTYKDVYQIRNFYFFLTSEWDSPFLFPRFQAVFAEPGHLGMIAALLLFVQSYNLSKWYNLILFLGALFSFSLASYVLMALGALLLIFIRYKHSIVYVVSIVLLCGAIVTVINRVVGEYNLFNQLIVERLTIEDGQIAGNNRFSSDFEDEYERKKETSAVWFGWQPDFSQYDGGNAGYKRYISEYGLVGLFVCIITYLSFCRGYSRKYAYSLFLLYAASFLQRAYPFWASELIIFICGLPLLCSSDSASSISSTSVITCKCVV